MNICVNFYSGESKGKKMFDLINNNKDTNGFIKVDDKIIKSEDCIIRNKIKIAYFTKSTDKTLNSSFNFIITGEPLGTSNWFCYFNLLSKTC